MRVIIDTDPGLDDAVAILWALAEPGMTVEAITTVAGNIGLGLTTRNALRLTALAGTPTPVIPGAPRPLAREGRDETRIHGRDGLGGVMLPEPAAAPEPGPAADWLAARLLAEPPGAFELHCLGPLTNLALLLDRAPQAAARLHRVIAMGGAVHEPGNMGPKAEFNFAHDPEALDLVLKAGLDLTLVPLDVTRRVRADAAWLARLARSPRPRAQAVAALVAAYFDATPGAGPESRPLHDPCVPVLARHPGLFGIETLHLTTDLTTHPGALIPGSHPVKVAMTVDGSAVLETLAAGLE